MISMTFTGSLFCKSCLFYKRERAKTDASILQKTSGLSQGPVHPFARRLTVRGRGPIALPRQGEFTMSEQAVEDRRGWASDIMWVALYSILVLLAMLLWI